MRKYKFLLLIPVLFLTSCKKWLDVKPKAEVEADVIYERESGFKDVLWGVYVNMTAPEMYGREMTYGLVDVIGNVYPKTGNVYGYAKRHEYNDRLVEPRINQIWQSTYKTIANVNNLIQNIRAADRSLFAADNYNVILGEALGLRAFLHFDMLRLFAPSYKSSPSAPAIPYVTVSDFNITPTYVVADVIDSILKDFREAEELLKVADPIVTGRQITASIDEGYLLKRPFRMNYYAVKASLARVYLYKGDNLNAAKYADEVINSGKFEWVKVDNIAVGNETLRDRTFSPEQVFVLDIQRLAEHSQSALYLALTGTAGPFSVYFETADINRVFPEATDWRKLYFWTTEGSGTTPSRYNTKLRQIEGMPKEFARRMPMIRMPELFLISAEASLETDNPKAIDRIRTLRVHRGLPAGIPDGTTVETLQSEILREHLREFIGEGLLFYYYKRIDASKMDGVSGTFNKEKYVLPIPIEERDFR